MTWNLVDNNAVMILVAQISSEINFKLVCLKYGSDNFIIPILKDFKNFIACISLSLYFTFLTLLMPFFEVFF